MKKVINNFKKNLKLALSLLFIVHCSLSTAYAQQTITDTLLYHPTLCGLIDKYKIFNQPDSHFFGVWPNLQSFGVGDETSMTGCTTYFFRTFLTFETQPLLSAKQQGYEVFIESAKIELYSGWGIGNGVSQVYPIMGSDTVLCMADHISYGSVLDTTDWTAGDLLDPQTITPQVAVAIKLNTISQVALTDFPVTSSLQYDIDNDNSMSQYRCAFPNIESDFDCVKDKVHIMGTNSSVTQWQRPKMLVTYTLFNYGDIDFDSFVTELDAQIILESIVSDSALSDLNLKVGDVDGNGKLQVNDASLILQFAKGLITQFPVEL